jgi:hypothetical protein
MQLSNQLVKSRLSLDGDAEPKVAGLRHAQLVDPSTDVIPHPRLVGLIVLVSEGMFTSGCTDDIHQ